MITIDFRFPKFLEEFRRARGELDLFIAAMLQTNRGMIFDKEGAYNGRDRWADLKCRSGQILSDSGRLRRSMAPLNPTGRAGADGIVRLAGNEITIGTQVAYAEMMNDGTKKLPGGVLRPTNAKALRFECGGKVIFRKSVKIPARPFDDWTDEDAHELDEAVSNWLNDFFAKQAS